MKTWGDGEERGGRGWEREWEVGGGVESMEKAGNGRWKSAQPGGKNGGGSS